MHTAPPGGCCQTVSALVIVPAADPLVLLHQHKRYPLVLPPGGHVEPQENPWTAVLRELREETGLAARTLSVLQPLPIAALPGALPTPIALDVHPVDQGRHHADLAFAFVAMRAAALRPGAAESAQVGWTPLSAMPGLSALPGRVAGLARLIAARTDSWLRTPADRILL